MKPTRPIRVHRHPISGHCHRVELYLTLALNTPTYSYAYPDATVDGLTRLTELMSTAASG